MGNSPGKTKWNPGSTSPWSGLGAAIRHAGGPGYKVKKVVDPGCHLSLQLQHHRAEHWVVVQGVAQVTIDDKGRPGIAQPEYLHPAGDGLPPGKSRHRAVSPHRSPDR